MVTDSPEAYATCARFARDHYENFPVASRLLPRAMRPHVAAVYAFARVADDFADEGDRPQDVRTPMPLLHRSAQGFSPVLQGFLPRPPTSLPPSALQFTPVAFRSPCSTTCSAPSGRM